MAIFESLFHQFMSLALFWQLLIILTLYILYLVIRYPNRAIGARNRPDLAMNPNAWPVLGDTIMAFQNRKFRLESQEENMEKYAKNDVLYGTMLGLGGNVNLLNVKDVEAVLRDPYTFEKGPFLKIISGPLLGNGIFASDGHIWTSQRKTASAVFNVRNFRDVFSGEFLREVDLFMGHLENCRKRNAFIDLQDIFLRSTLDGFTRLAMGKDLGCLHVEGKVIDGKYHMEDVKFMEAFDYVNGACAARFSNPFWSITEHFDGTRAKIKESQAIMYKVADDIIEEKRAQIRADDMVDLSGEKLASVDYGQDYKNMLDYFLRTCNFDGSPPTQDQLRDTVMNLIIAGRDTTAQTLTWVFYELYHNPRCEQLVREEVLNVLGKDGQPDYESIKSLKYTHAVFNEALRLHSNVPMNLKTCTKDTVLPGTGTKVYQGDIISFSTWIMNRSTKVWGPDAREFKPERWLTKDETGTVSVKKENQYKYAVFNAGPRKCLGESMAIQEGICFIASIVRKFHLELVNEDDPNKWGLWDEDPSKRKGRYIVALTLGLRQGMDFRVHSVEQQ